MNKEIEKDAKNIPHKIGISSSLRISMATTAIIPPSDREPVSPINTCAGYELYHIKPTQAPTKADI